MRSLISSKRLWTLGVLLLVVIGGIFGYSQLSNQEIETDETPEVQTAVARRGDLILLASGSGTLIVSREASLGFGTTGPIAALNVDVGDQVEEGQILAVQGDREQLEASVSADQLSVLEAQEALDHLFQQADLVAAQAMLELANARDSLEDANYTNYVQQRSNRASQSTIDTAQANLVLAQYQLDAAQNEYNKYYGRPTDDPGRALALTRLAAAQNAYDSTLRNLNWYLGEPTELQQLTLDAEVAIAEADLAEAERNYERLKDGPDPDDVARAELQLQNAQAKLAISERNIEEAVIAAPFSGMVMEVNGQVGQTISGDFITLADLSQPYMEIYLDETDLDKMVVGNEVEAIFDALPDLVFTGHIAQVDPSLVFSQGFSTIRGEVLFDGSDGEVLSSMPVGLSASVDVIAGKAEGAVLVPYEALRELGPGEYAFFVQENGELTLRPVEVGLMDFSFAEILSGLEAGEVVTTGIVETE